MKDVRSSSSPSLRVWALLVLLAAGCSNGPTGPDYGTPYEWETASPMEVGIDAAGLEAAADSARSLGFVRSLLVVRDGVLVNESYMGGASAGEPWQIRSATKSVTSALIGIGLEQGYLSSLDQHLVDFFPEYVTEETDPRIHQVTLRQLLTMTAGFASDAEDAVTPDTFNPVQTAFQLPLSADPGTEYLYSSLGSHLLSAVLQKASGRSPIYIAESRLFGPMGAELPVWATDNQGIPVGGAGMRLFPRDMARFGQLYLEGGAIDGTEVVPAAWVEESLAVQVQGTAAWGAVDSVSYGYQWWAGSMSGHRISYAYGHAGQMIVLVSDLDLVVTSTTSFPDPSQGDAQARAVMYIIADHILPACGPLP